MGSIEVDQKRFSQLSLWLFIYAAAYAFMNIMPVFLRFDIKNGFMVAELFDLFTPFVMVFLVYKLYTLLTAGSRQEGGVLNLLTVKIILIFGAVTFVEGHGMHLSANALARLIDPSATPALFSLNYFFDEILGHILWDSGIIFLSIGLILLGFRLNGDSGSKPPIIPIAIASLIYGFTYFVNAVEGQTVVFTFPVAVIIPALILLITGRRHIRLTANPLLIFFSFAYIVSVCLFIIWAIWQGGFPEFSELGWI